MARCPFAVWEGVGSHGGPMTASLGAIEHVTTNHGDPFSWFANRAHQASSHFWIADDGKLVQYIDTDVASWAQAAGNYQYVSVETSGTPDQPLTAAQVAAFAKLYRWGHDAFGWPYTLAERPGDKGLGWHGMGGASWGGHLGCPGNLRKGQRAQILAMATAMSNPAPPSPPLPILFIQFKDTMQLHTITVPGLDADGKGYYDLPDVPAGRVISVRVNTADYAPVPSSPGDQNFNGYTRVEFVGLAHAPAFGARVWVAEQ